MSGTFSVKVERPTDYSDFLLGLKPLPVVNFAAAETRWGISLPLRLKSQPASVLAIPTAHEVEAVWRRPGTLAAVRLMMRATVAPAFVEEGRPNRHWRVVHPNLEMRFDGKSCDLAVSGPDIVSTGYRALVQLHALMELLASDEPTEVQLLQRGNLVQGWRHDAPIELWSREVAAAQREMLQELGVILSRAGLHDIQIPAGSWREWRKSPRTVGGEAMARRGRCPQPGGPTVVVEGEAEEAPETVAVTAMKPAEGITMSVTPSDAGPPLEMEIFFFDRDPKQQVRTVNIDGQPWFVGSDVAARLGYADPTNAMKRHCEGVAKHHPLSSRGGVQHTRLISEPDVYRLVVGSHLPSAQRFERWVFEEVLPAIRKTGGYVGAAPEDPPEVIMAKAHAIAQRTIADHEARLAAQAHRIAEQDGEIVELKEEVAELQPKAEELNLGV